MNQWGKTYELPVCSVCSSELFFEQVYHQGKLYKVNLDGHPDNVDLSPIFHEQERLDFERLVCLKCKLSYEASHDRQGRLQRGKKF